MAEAEVYLLDTMLLLAAAGPEISTKSSEAQGYPKIGHEG